MQVLYARDARSLPRYTLSIVDKDGARVEGPIEFDIDWGFAEYVKGYGGVVA